MTVRGEMARRGFLPVADIARSTGYTQDTIRRWARTGEVKCERVGRGGRATPSIYVSAADVAYRIGGDASTLFEPKGRARVYLFGSNSQADAFVKGCQRFAPPATLYFREKHGRQFGVRIVTEGER